MKIAEVAEQNINTEELRAYIRPTLDAVRGEVEKLLRISDATATRYLDILEKEGKIRQEGKTGKYVVYVKI